MPSPRTIISTNVPCPGSPTLPSPSLRENNTGSFPRGLSLMLRAVGAWIYDRDPYVPIQVRACARLWDRVNLHGHLRGVVGSRACVRACVLACVCIVRGRVRARNSFARTA